MFCPGKPAVELNPSRSPVAPAIASHPTIATSGSLMRVTKLNSGDRWLMIQHI